MKKPETSSLNKDSIEPCIIGAKGEKIREIKNKFNQVQVTFPDPGKKSDIVTFRGPKNDVDKCYKYLQTLQQEMVRKIK